MFDSHAHVCLSHFNEDRAEVILRAREAGLSGWLEVGTDIQGSRQAIALAQAQDGVVATVGVHPSDIGDLTPDSWSELEKLLENPKVVAVGEVGLDYYRGGTKQAQLPVLERFYTLARQRALPLVFHVRDGKQVSAHEDLLTWLESLPQSEVSPGVVHTFSGSSAQAERYLALGLYLSFSGVVTFKNAGEIADVASSMPLTKLLVETDCPFLAPDPHRGQRNEPAYVALVIQKIADLRQAAFTEIAKATTANAYSLFELTE